MKENKTSVNNTQKKRGGYGVLSLMAMTIGVVIGSGIFVQNEGIIQGTGSVSNVVFTWLIGSLVMISIVIAFFEVISVTEISGEQSTIANYGRKLVGIRFGKFIGYYTVWVYIPIVISALFRFGSMYFLDTLTTALGTPSWLHGVNKQITMVGIGFAFLIIITLVNSIMVKPGKYFQNIGTLIKTIPIIVIIALAFVIVGGVAVGNPMVDPGFDQVTNTDTSGKADWMLIFAIVPGVLFSFDGFLSAGPLSKEAKKPSTFKLAYILSIGVIIILYFLFSVGVLYLGSNEIDTEKFGAYGTINNALYNIFGDTHLADVVVISTSGVITISILTSASGGSISTARTLSDLSVHNSVKDTDMRYIDKNKNGVAEAAGYSIMAITAFWFLLSSGMDTYITIVTKTTDANKMTSIAGFSTYIESVLAFLIYVIIIIGAFVNRFRRAEDKINPESGEVVKKATRVPVKKNILFFPAAIVAILLTTSITLYFGYTIIQPMLTGDWSDPVIKLQFIYTMIFFAVIVFSNIYHSITTRRLKPEFIAKKERYAKIYYGEEVEELDVDLVRSKLTTMEAKIDLLAEKAIKLQEKNETLEAKLGIKEEKPKKSKKK